MFQSLSASLVLVTLALSVGCARPAPSADGRLALVVGERQPAAQPARYGAVTISGVDHAFEARLAPCDPAASGEQLLRLAPGLYAVDVVASGPQDPLASEPGELIATRPRLVVVSPGRVSRVELHVLDAESAPTAALGAAL